MNGEGSAQVRPPSRLKGQWIRIAVVVAVWAFFSILFARQWTGDSQIWTRLFAVPPMEQHFADLGQVAAAVASVQHGFDPYVHNSYDLDKRRFIYPRLWIYLFSALRITPRRSFAAGVMMACCFLLVVSWLVWRQKDVWASVLIGLAACSGAAALAVERGNTDILILALIVIASEIEARGGVWLLITASVLKVYPFFALLAEAVIGRRTRLLLLALVIAAAGILAQHGDFSRQENSIPHGYGLKEIDIAMQRAPARVQAAFSSHLLVFRVLWASVLATLAATGAATGVAWARRRRVIARSSGNSGAGIYLFVLCTSIFIGTFLVSTSYDYRLVFLIPMVPFLVDQARSATDRLPRTLGAAGLFLIIFGANRGTARMIHSPLLTALLKTASHVDLWALLWTVSFFMGLISVVHHRIGEEHSKAPGAKGPLRKGLMKEPA